MSRIYVASSWRNQDQPLVVEKLRGEGHEVYDFRHPAEGNDGFTWKNVMPSWSPSGGGTVPVEEYVANIGHPKAVEGFGLDFDAMKWADTCVLVLPCGRSAHLELGWAVGAHRRTAIILDGPNVVPELMYRMVDLLATDVGEVIDWLRPYRQIEEHPTPWTWSTVPIGWLVPGSGIVVEKRPHVGGFHVTFRRLRPFDEHWAAYRSACEPVPVALTSGGLLCSRMKPGPSVKVIEVGHMTTDTGSSDG